MKKSLLIVTVAAAAMFVSAAPVHAQATGTVVFDSIPAGPPANVPSQGYQCCGTSEVGDEILLEADTPRLTGFATVLMSSWSLHANYPGMSSAGYQHPITLNIYRDSTEANAHTPWKTVTQTFTIPWRPAADSACGATATTWKGPDGVCYNGFAFTIVFDLRGLNVNLP